jgi:hypothetical protein
VVACRPQVPSATATLSTLRVVRRGSTSVEEGGGRGSSVGGDVMEAVLSEVGGTVSSEEEVAPPE